MSSRKQIYVETLIRGEMEELWRLTQSPDLHERWDLRFSEIRYLPRPNPARAQEFVYATRIGFGLKIEGRGESVGERTSAGGERSSSLRFWSNDAKSLILEGSGYWKYVPVDGGVKFLTLYDYRVRFGAAGAVVDRFLFRPLMGWATAWSFDRLRLWIERGIPPEVTMRVSAAHAIAKGAVAAVWCWHGLVPKLIFHHPDESRMLTDAGISNGVADRLVTAAGWFEILLAVAIFFYWRSRIPMFITIALMTGAVGGVITFSPDFLRHAFNPLTLNLLMISGAAVALTTQPLAASAAYCRRRKGDEAV